MNSNLLKNSWVHSYEEDTNDEIVFRPSNYTFPLRRGGRDAIDLNADNTFTQRGDFPAGLANLSSNDQYAAQKGGTWNLEANEILMQGKNAGAITLRLKVLELSDNKLVFEK